MTDTQSPSSPRTPPSSTGGCIWESFTPAPLACWQSGPRTDASTHTTSLAPLPSPRLLAILPLVESWCAGTDPALANTCASSSPGVRGRHDGTVGKRRQDSTRDEVSDDEFGLGERLVCPFAVHVIGVCVFVFLYGSPWPPATDDYAPEVFDCQARWARTWACLGIDQPEAQTGADCDRLGEDIWVCRRYLES